MFHLAAFYATVTDSTTNQALNGVLDQSLTLSANNRFLYPKPQTVLAAFAMGDAITTARVNAPSLRTFLLPSISPVEIAGVPGDVPAFVNYGANGPRLLQTEETTIEVSVGAQTVDTAFGALWTTDRPEPPVTGQIYTARATATITLTVGTWVLGALTFEQVLPTGTYAVVGLNVTAADLVFARLVFPGENNYRPGVIAMPNAGAVIANNPFRNGQMGVWGRFQNTAQPQLEVLGMAAGAEAITVFLDLIKVG